MSNNEQTTEHPFPRLILLNDTASLYTVDHMFKENCGEEYGVSVYETDSERHISRFASIYAGGYLDALNSCNLKYSILKKAGFSVKYKEDHNDFFNTVAENCDDIPAFIAEHFPERFYLEEITGYSQGDYVKLLIEKPTDPESFNRERIKEYFEQYFFDGEYTLNGFLTTDSEGKETRHTFREIESFLAKNEADLSPCEKDLYKKYEEFMEIFPTRFDMLKLDFPYNFPNHDHNNFVIEYGYY